MVATPAVPSQVRLPYLGKVRLPYLGGKEFARGGDEGRGVMSSRAPAGPRVYHPSLASRGPIPPQMGSLAAGGRSPILIASRAIPRTRAGTVYDRGVGDGG